MGTKHIIVDPITRIEGHLRIEAVIDENNVIQHESANALDTGRSVDEIIRTLNALKSGGLTACNWVPGDNFVGE